MYICNYEKEEGKEILPYYDPMLAKLICWGENRDDAIQKMLSLLRDYVLLGIRHNLDVLHYLIRSDAFQKGTYHTPSVSELLEDFLKEQAEQQKAFSSLSTLKPRPLRSAEASSSTPNPIESFQGFRNV